jgi:hypothetical protein
MVFAGIKDEAEIVNLWTYLSLFNGESSKVTRRRGSERQQIFGSRRRPT